MDRLNAHHKVLTRFVAISTILLLTVSHAHAQAGTVIIRVGKWLGEQLISYGVGKVIDRVAGLDCEKQLKQVEANLSLKISRETKDKEKIRAELTATQSQLRILNALLRSNPTTVDVEQFRQQLAKDLDRVLIVQEKHDQRITKLESEVADLTLRLRRLEAGPPPPVASVVGRTSGPRTFNVSITASAPWASTGILLAKGERLAIQARGRAATVPGTYSGPRGQQYRCDGNCTLPSGYYGQLVGRIGINGQAFLVGEQMSIIASSSGELFLAVNDCCDWSDNDGAFTAFVSVDAER